MTVLSGILTHLSARLVRAGREMMDIASLMQVQKAGVTGLEEIGAAYAVLFGFLAVLLLGRGKL